MLNENIRNMRMALGLSQDELAEKLHVVRQTVSKWEKGHSVPDAGLLRELARQLNTTVTALLGKTVDPSTASVILPGAVPAEISLDQLMGAVDIGGTKMQIGLVTGNGTILGARSFATDSREQPGEEAVLKIAEELRALCREAGVPRESLCGIGVFCAGPVDTQKGTVENPYTLPGWEGLPLVSLLSEATGLSVRLENDANGALLGEVFSQGIAHRRVLMVTIGTGIGVAFWDGEGLYRTGRYHPEMGHIIVTDRGPECYCGHRGCFESLCSGKAINDRAQAAGYADFEDLLAHTYQDNAQTLLSKIQQNFKSGIWSLRVVFKPDVLILAGGFAKSYFSILQQPLTDPSENKEDFSGLAEILPESNVPNAALMGVCMLPWKKKKRRRLSNETV